MQRLEALMLDLNARLGIGDVVYEDSHRPESERVPTFPPGW